MSPMYIEIPYTLLQTKLIIKCKNNHNFSFYLFLLTETLSTIKFYHNFAKSLKYVNSNFCRLVKLPSDMKLHLKSCCCCGLEYTDCNSCSGVGPTQKSYFGYDSKLHLMMRIELWRMCSSTSFPLKILVSSMGEIDMFENYLRGILDAI